MKFNELQYLVRYPENFDENKKYPVIFFLHGAGTRANDTKPLENNSCFLNITAYAASEFIVYAPLCETHNWNSYMQTLIAFVEYVKEQNFTDTERFYLTGNSMGGYGTWELACQMDNTFAAIMPVCGGGMQWLAYRLKDTPIRAFHGVLDDVVLPTESINMVAAVNKKGGNAELITFPHVKHNVWNYVYTDKAQLDWLTSHTLSKGELEKDALKGEIYG